MPLHGSNVRTGGFAVRRNIGFLRQLYLPSLNREKKTETNYFTSFIEYKIVTEIQNLIKLMCVFVLMHGKKLDRLINFSY